MTEQAQKNKDKLGRIQTAQDELIDTLIVQALHAAKTAGLSANVWMDGGELRITIRGARQQYMIFTDKDKSDIGGLVDAVEWLLSQPPKKDESEESEE
jgi:hypothetical protein